MLRVHGGGVRYIPGGATSTEKTTNYHASSEVRRDEKKQVKKYLKKDKKYLKKVLTNML